MPVFDIDLEDGFKPIAFSLPPVEAPRFIEFMEGYNKIQLRIAELDELLKEQQHQLEVLCEGTGGSTPATVTIMRLREELEARSAWMKNSEGLKCPSCDDIGGFAVRYSNGEWQQMPCQFCHECPDSLFNRHLPKPPEDAR